VLTAAHVVAGAVNVWVRNPDKHLYPATVGAHFVGQADGPSPDLALVEIDDAAADLPPMPLARVNRDSLTIMPVMDCQAVGYPWFGEQPRPTAIRDTVHVYGRIPVLSKLARGLLSVAVSDPPRPLPAAERTLAESEWSGMSGGPVVAAGYLLGVVTEHAPREGPGFITATPLSALEADPKHPGWGAGVRDPAAWWARMGTSGVSALELLPRQPEPAYRATIRQIRDRTRSLARRADELAAIHTFATGPDGYQWLIGDAWAGKTALLAAAVTAELQADVDVVAYFLSRQESDASSNQFLAAVTPQLADLVTPGEEVRAADIHQFRALWTRAAQLAEDRRRPLLLVVDGLDEDLRPAGSPSVAAVLPQLAGYHAHMLVSSRSNHNLDLSAGHPLQDITPVALAPSEDAGSLAELARQEISELVRRPGHLAIRLLGLLAAAAGPLAVGDLIRLSRSLGASASDGSAWPAGELSLDEVHDADRFLSEDAARSLLQVGTPENPERQRYQYAHASLLEDAQKNRYLGDRRFRDAIHRWADDWRSRHWRDGGGDGVPTYLLESYPATLVPGSDQDGDLGRLEALTSDVSWVAAAVRALGIDRVLATLRTAASALPDDRHTGGNNGATTTALLASALRSESYALRSPQTRADDGLVLRQLCLHGLALGDRRLVADCTDRLLELPPPQLVPRWTTMPSGGRLLTRQFGRIVSVSVSTDGNRTVVGMGQEVQLFDGDGLFLRSLAPGGHVHAAAISGDGRCIAAVGSGMKLGVFDSRTGSLTRRLPGPVRSWSLGLSADGTVVVFDQEGEAGIWHTAQAQARTVPAPRGWPDAVGVSGDGQRVVTCRNNGPPTVWDEATGTLYVPAEDHPACAVAISADGAIAVSGDVNGTLRAWDVTSGQSIGTSQPHHRQITAIAITADGSLAIAGDQAGRVLRWDPAREIVIGAAAHLGAVSAIAVTADGGCMLSGGDDGTVWEWDALSATGDSASADSGSPGTAHVLELGGSVIVTGGDQGLLRVRDLVTGEPIRDLPGPADGEPTGPIRAVAASLDGSVIVAGGQDPRVLVWGQSSPAPTVLRGHRTDLYAVAVTRDGASVFAGDARGVVVGWDVATRALLPVTYEAGWTVGALAVTPDGRWLVCGNDRGEVWRWRVATGAGEMILRRPGDPGQLDPRVSAVAVSPDGGRIAVVNGDGSLRAWVNGVASPEIRGRGLNQVWTVAADGTAAMIDDHILLQVKPVGGVPLHAVTPAPVTAVALGPGNQGGPRALAITHPGDAVTMFQLSG
jgi:WD40 repeat protein